VDGSLAERLLRHLPQVSGTPQGQSLAGLFVSCFGHRGAASQNIQHLPCCNCNSREILDLSIGRRHTFPCLRRCPRQSNRRPCRTDPAAEPTTIACVTLFASSVTQRSSPSWGSHVRRRRVGFYVAEHNTKLPHSVFQGQTTDEIYFGRGENVPEQLAEARRIARDVRLQTNRGLSCDGCRAAMTEFGTSQLLPPEKQEPQRFQQ